MKTFTKLTALMMVFLISLSSCETKEKDPKPATKTELLTATTWKVNKVLANGTDYTSHDGVKRYATSEVLYKTDGTYIWKHFEGTYSGNWEFGSNETVIWEDKGTTDELKWDIKELKANSFITNQNKVDANGTPFVLELQWVKK